MNEYAGIKMDIKENKGGAKSIDPNQGGNKAAERAGAGQSIVSHPMVDKIDHGGKAYQKNYNF